MLYLYNPDSVNWTTNTSLDIRALNYTDSWEEGVIPLELTYLTSHEAFDGFYGIKMEGAPGAYNSSSFQSTQTGTSERDLFLLGIGGSIAGQDRHLRVLATNPNSSYLKSLNLPPTWKSNGPVRTISMVVSTIVKFIVNILQVFLMFVRPFQTRYRNRWTMWFGSSLQQLQMWLGMGGVTGNFGGVIDDIQVGQLQGK